MWLIFVVLIKDGTCKLGVEVEEVGEGDEDGVFAIIEGHFCLSLILEDSLVREALDEVGEFLPDVFGEVELAFL